MRELVSAKGMENTVDRMGDLGNGDERTRAYIPNRKLVTLRKV